MRWRREPSETGLRAVVAWPASHWLCDNGQRLACVSPGDRLGRSWYFVAGWGRLPHRNTCNAPVDSIEQAKRDAVAYVREQLALLPAAPAPSFVITTGETK